MAERGPMLGEAVLKLQPKLRMFANGSTEVNLVRAEQCSAIAIDPSRVDEAVLKKLRPRTELTVMADLADLPRGSVDHVEPGVLANVFIQTTPGDDTTARFEGETARRGHLVTAVMPLERLQETAGRRDVSWIEVGEELRRPRPRLESGAVSAPGPAQRAVPHDDRHAFGERTLIGHHRRPGLRLRAPGLPRRRRRYALRAHLGPGRRQPPDPPNRDRPVRRSSPTAPSSARSTSTRARRARRAVPATTLEPQSQMDEGSHGTHVASIAAGNRGVCRTRADRGRADLAARGRRGPAPLVLRLDPPRRTPSTT